MYHFIINPYACNGRGMKIWRRVEKKLNHLGENYEAHITEEQGDCRRIAKELTGKGMEPRIIVVVGGDGTMNEVLDGLSFGGPVTIGYIPAGSGNDLARSLRLPKSPGKCLRKVLNPKYHKQLDYGVISYGEESEHRRFMVSSGIGLDAAVCHDILAAKVKQGVKKLRFGKWWYIFLGIKQLLIARPVKGYLLLDGTQKVEFNHLYFVSAHIHPYEGGGFKFAPGADPCDGRLTVRVVHQENKPKLVPILLGALRGSRKKYPGSRIYTCQEMEVHTERPMPVHADGESCMCQKDIQIRCIPHRVRMIV